MTEYSGNEGKKFEDKLSIMHYNNSTQEYKVLAVNPLEDGKGVFLGIRVGTKGSQPNKLTLMLNPQEVAYLIMGLTKVFNQELK